MTSEQRGHCRTWVEKLKSGRFRQAQGRLVRHNGDARYCCLGVGSLLMPCATEKPGGFQYETGITPAYVRGCMPSPRNFRNYFGIDEDAQGRLAGLNDEGLDFDGIAKRIERMMS